MKPTLDRNADLGEEVTDDVALLEVVTSANVACGGHAGTPEIMRVVCAGAAERGVAIGAQVSYVDRPNFGRRAIEIEPSLLREQVVGQCELLSYIATATGTVVSYVKAQAAPHHRIVDNAEPAAADLAGHGDMHVSTEGGRARKEGI